MKKTKKDPIMKIMRLIEKECALYDRRPKKERKEHPSGTCYMNDIMHEIEKLIDVSCKLRKK